MAKEKLELNEVAAMFKEVAQSIINHVDLLTKADQAIGDGDHGIGMQRGFEAVITEIDSGDFDTLGALMKKVGFALMNSSGGASGAIFGSLFLGAGRGLGDETRMSAGEFSIMLNSGMEAVQKRGKAEPGDKTMIDALAPAAETALDLSTLAEGIQAIADAARDGMEKTKEMVASFGRAKSLGERAIGNPDPGAISMHLILQAMADYMADL